MGKSKKKSGKCKCCTDVDQLRKDLRQTTRENAALQLKEDEVSRQLVEVKNELQVIKDRNVRARNKVERLRRFGPPNPVAFRREMDRLMDMLKRAPIAGVHDRRGPVAREPIEFQQSSSNPVDWDALTREINEAWAHTQNELGKAFKEFRDAYNKKEKRE